MCIYFYYFFPLVYHTWQNVVRSFGLPRNFLYATSVLSCRFENVLRHMTALCELQTRYKTRQRHEQDESDVSLAALWSTDIIYTFYWSSIISRFYIVAVEIHWEMRINGWGIMRNLKDMRFYSKVCITSFEFRTLDNVISCSCDKLVTLS